MACALKGLWTDETGVVAAEYALLMATVTLGALAAWGELGRTVANVMLDMTKDFDGAAK